MRDETSANDEQWREVKEINNSGAGYSVLLRKGRLDQEVRKCTHNDNTLGLRSVISSGLSKN
jgi:hypothetical protein